MINRQGARAGGVGVAEERLIESAAALGVQLKPADAMRLERLIAELERWNRRVNLTAIRDPQRMRTHHLLDSLAVHQDLIGTRIADVGTGAGFPGLPLALVNPERQFTLIDSNGKKIRFVEHAIRELGLANATALQARIEALRPAPPFDTVLARAFAPLPELLEKVAGVCGPGTRVLALKGRWPAAEIAALPPTWQILSSRPLEVPDLQGERCLIVLRPAATPSSP
ncbi:MAG: 16S rRNA (guanine(527)-N(7))-methyltransferase RsmG [Gammaproteobacteria bacterium]|nr:16S rRNA (guanine(527)-N(7))-methyltransferase RsmG [Gammaproteobacteria bacterium]